MTYVYVVTNEDGEVLNCFSNMELAQQFVSSIVCYYDRKFYVTKWKLDDSEPVDEGSDIKTLEILQIFKKVK